MLAAFNLCSPRSENVGVGRMYPSVVTECVDRCVPALLLGGMARGRPRRVVDRYNGSQPMKARTERRVPHSSSTSSTSGYRVSTDTTYMTQVAVAYGTCFFGDIAFAVDSKHNPAHRHPFTCRFPFEMTRRTAKNKLFVRERWLSLWRLPVSFRQPFKVRNELTSAEFALNLNGAGSSSRGSSSSSGTGGGGGMKGQAKGNSSGSAESPSSTTSSPAAATAAGGGSGGGSKVEIDFDSIAERLEGSLRALQAGRPLSLLEAVSEDEVRYNTLARRGVPSTCSRCVCACVCV